MSDHEAMPFPHDRIAKYVLRKCPDGPRPLPEEVNYANISLCAVNAVFSIDERESASTNAARRFAKNLKLRHRSTDETGIVASIGEVVSILDCDFACPENATKKTAWAKSLFGNTRHTSARGRRRLLKGEAVLRFLGALKAAGIETFDDVQCLTRMQIAESLVMEIPGQHSGLSFSLFRKLCGLDDAVKADRRVKQSIAAILHSPSDASDRANEFTDARVRLLCSLAAAKLRESCEKWNVSLLDEFLFHDAKSLA